MTTMTKGALPLMSAQAMFVLTGFALTVFLARWLTPDVYGLWGIVISLLVLVEYSMMGVLGLTAAKLVSEDRMAVGRVARVTLRLQMATALVVGVALFLLAPTIARLLNDPRLTFYFRLAVLDIPLTGLFVAYSGLLSGLMEFHKRALVAMAYSIAKVVGVLLFVMLGFSLTGAIMGKICASGLAVLVAFRMCRYERDMERVTYSRIVGFSTPVFFLHLAGAALGGMGLYCLKALAAEPLVAGWYTAVQNVTKAPRMVFSGVTGALLPSFSSAISAGEPERGVEHVAQAVRLLFMLLLPTVFVVSATAEELITLVFTEAYLPAALPLKLLMVGVILGGFASVMLTTITAENRPTLTLGIVLIQIPVALFLYVSLIPKYGIIGAAGASVLTSGFSGFVAFLYLAKKYRGLVPLPNLVRITIASSVVLGIVHVLPMSGMLLLPSYLALALGYVSLLWLMNEVTQEEKAWVKTMGTSVKSAILSSARKADWRAS